MIPPLTTWAWAQIGEPSEAPPSSEQHCRIYSTYLPCSVGSWMVYDLALSLLTTLIQPNARSWILFDQQTPQIPTPPVAASPGQPPVVSRLHDAPGTDAARPGELKDPRLRVQDAHLAPACVRHVQHQN